MKNNIADHCHTDICKPCLKVGDHSPNFFEIVNNDQTNLRENGFGHEQLNDEDFKLQFLEK